MDAKAWDACELTKPKNENYRRKQPENRKNGLYEPENAIFRLFLRFLRPPGMKFRKNESVEQGVPPYAPQAARR